MNEPTEVKSAIDAVRCLYLAKEAERRGDEETAERWHAKAVAWVSRLDAGARRMDDALPSSDKE